MSCKNNNVKKIKEFIYTMSYRKKYKIKNKKRRIKKLYNYK